MLAAFEALAALVEEITDPDRGKVLQLQA